MLPRSEPAAIGLGLALVAMLLASTGGSADLGQLVGDVNPFSAVDPPDVRHEAAQSYGDLPLAFHQPPGEDLAEGSFITNGQGYQLTVDPQGSVLNLSREVGGRVQEAALRMTIVGADPDAPVAGQDQLPGRVNYLVGSDSSRWATDLSTFGAVVYDDVYPGIDAVYRGDGGELEYDFVVAPGQDPADVSLRFEGATSQRLDEHGDLIFELATGEVRHQAPVAYQDVDGTRRDVPAEFVLDGNEVRFRLGAYDPGRALVIDPLVDYATFLGGAGSDVPEDIAVDSAGSAYITGSTRSANFPVSTGALQTGLLGSTNSFVTKLAPDGGSVAYSTYVVGATRAIAVDNAGYAYITGIASSNVAYPTTPGAFQTTGSGLFASKLSLDGSTFEYSTFAGVVSTGGRPISIGIGPDGSAYLAGTTSGAIPVTKGAFQPVYGGGEDAYVVKVNPSGTALGYATYLGGASFELANAIAVGDDGSAYIVGRSSGGFPTTPGAFKEGNGFDAFVSKLDSSGSVLEYSTLLGGDVDRDEALAVAVDDDGHAFVAGSTNSAIDFPTTEGAFLSLPGGSGGKGFVTKMDVLGSALEFSTFVGTRVRDVALDEHGQAYLVGAAGRDLAITEGAFPLMASNDDFAGKLSATGDDLVFASFLPGVSCLSCKVAVDAMGDLYISARSERAQFVPITPGAFQPTPDRRGSIDGVVMKLSTGGVLSLAMSDTPDPVLVGQPLTYTLTVDNINPSVAPVDATNVVVRNTLPTEVSFDSATASQGSCVPPDGAGTMTCMLGDLPAGSSATIELTVVPGAGIGGGSTSPEAAIITNSAVVTADQQVPASELAMASEDTTVARAGCGAVITEDTTLTGDVGPCPSDGFVIAADGITLDLNGHSLFGYRGPGEGNGAGIRLTDRTGVVVRNGRVAAFDAGIVIEGGGGNTVEELEIRDNVGPSDGPGGELGDGILVLHSGGNELRSNVVSGNGPFDGVGILGVDSNDNLVSDSIIENTFTPEQIVGGIGIIVNPFFELDNPRRGESISGNDIVNNVIRGNASAGISSLSNVDSEVRGNTVEGNGLTAFSPINGIGIQNLLQASPVTRVVVEDNRVHGNGGSGIVVFSQENTIRNNDVADNAVIEDAFDVAFDLYDMNADCDANIWSGNIWGSGGFDPECTTTGGSGPPMAAAAAPAEGVARPEPLDESRLRSRLASI